MNFQNCFAKCVNRNSESSSKAGETDKKAKGIFLSLKLEKNQAELKLNSPVSPKKSTSESLNRKMLIMIEEINPKNSQKSQPKVKTQSFIRLSPKGDLDSPSLSPIGVPGHPVSFNSNSPESPKFPQNSREIPEVYHLTASVQNDSPLLRIPEGPKEHRIKTPTFSNLQEGYSPLKEEAVSPCFGSIESVK